MKAEPALTASLHRTSASAAESEVAPVQLSVLWHGRDLDEVAVVARDPWAGLGEA